MWSHSLLPFGGCRLIYMYMHRDGIRVMILTGANATKSVYYLFEKTSFQGFFFLCQRVKKKEKKKEQFLLE